jgi:hypothetical protein
VAQPLATAVDVSASDGTHTSAPVSVNPAADGSWSATIPAAKLARLANATLTVTPVLAVPDVSTGASAHIAGVGASVKKSAPDRNNTPGDTSGPQQSAPAPSNTPGDSGGKQQPGPTGGQRVTSQRKPAAKPRVTTLRSASSLTLAAARTRGITASFLVPAGTRTIEVELLHGTKAIYLLTLPASKAGSSQTVRLGGSRLNKLLRRGHYTIAVRAGTGRSTLGAATMHGLTIR